MLEPVIPKNALLIFDFDQTITNQSMCNLFVSKGYSDYNSDEANPVTEEKIEEFVQNSGIKNEAKLKSVLQSALSSGVEVAIVSLAYPKAVEYVVKNHLDLEEQAQSIKVFEGVTKRQTPQIGDSTEIAEKMTKPQDPQIGKHLCVLYLLKAYKKDKGMLPQKVMLVDGNMRNTNPVDDFRRNIKGLLKKDMKSFLENIDQEIVEVDIKEEEIENITFKGINVSSEPTTETDKTVDDGYLGKVKRWIEGRSDIPLTPPPSYKSEDGSEKSLLSESEFGINSDATSENKKTNRIWPRAKYAIQQKGFIIFSATAIMFSASAALVYLQDKAKFAALFANGSLYVTIPVIALASLLVILPIYLAVKQFRNTGEYQTQGKNADKILDKVLEHQPKDKVIKSVRLEYSNGTHSNFVFNAWESKNDLINIDEKVVSRTNKIESVINDRPLFTALLASVVAANVALPLGLLTTGGVQTFYQNPLTNNIGLSLLVCSGALALLILCLGVHYYRKTNCTSLIYSQEKIDTENVNKKFVEEIERERTNVLKENHGKDAKCCSLTLEQVVVQSHNCKDAVYSVG